MRMKPEDLKKFMDGFRSSFPTMVPRLEEHIATIEAELAAATLQQSKKESP